MPVKKYNPITPGTRFRVGNTFTEVTTDNPEKSLVTSIKRTGGRNHDGKMTMRKRSAACAVFMACLLLATFPAPFGAAGAERDARSILRQRDSQGRARRLMRELLDVVLRRHMRQLEENGLAHVPLYKDLVALRGRSQELVKKEMSEAVALLTKAAAARGEEQTRIYKAAQDKMHEILLRVRGVSAVNEQVNNHPDFKRVKEFNTTQDSKTEMVRKLIADIESLTVELPTIDLCPELHTEFSTYTYKLSPTGKLSFSHIPGGHDDYVDSLMLANYSRIQFMAKKPITISNIKSVRPTFGTGPR